MISVVMICYEVASYVRQAIESVLAQDYKDFELILVAGMGGRDDTFEICHEYAGKDARIKIVDIKAKGPANARNMGMKHVTGDYLAFVDGDDYVERDMLGSLISNIEKYDADIAVCGRFYEYVNKSLSDEKGQPIVYTADEALQKVLSGQGFFLHCWDKMYRRNIFEGLYFREDVFVEDRIVVDELLGKAQRVVYDSTPKYHFRERSASQSKLKGMVRNNYIANEILQDYILNNHPAIKDDCERFMLYEYITALQNELVSDSPNKEDIKLYRSKIRQTKGKNNPLVGRQLKIKRAMALYCPLLLKIYTKSRQKNLSDDLKRFL